VKGGILPGFQAARISRMLEVHDPALHFLDTPLGARKAFSNAAAQGLAVTELTPQDRKATTEMVTLFRALFDEKNIS
jgi:chromosome partitioning protein